VTERNRWYRGRESGGEKRVGEGEREKGRLSALSPLSSLRGLPPPPYRPLALCHAPCSSIMSPLLHIQLSSPSRCRSPLPLSLGITFHVFTPTSCSAVRFKILGTYRGRY
jgi:hypothetical protein